jgi:hypothetical protein
MKTFIRFLRTLLAYLAPETVAPHEPAQEVSAIDASVLSYLSPAQHAVIYGLESREIVFAKDQPEYLPLRTLVSRDPQRQVMSRWTLTPEQRQAVAEGADVFLTLLTFGGPLQPISIAVSKEPSALLLHADFGQELRAPAGEA